MKTLTEWQKATLPMIAEDLADELVKMHNDTGIELQHWEKAMTFVSYFYSIELNFVKDEH